jgi:hypothetical protein
MHSLGHATTIARGQVPQKWESSGHETRRVPNQIARPGYFRENRGQSLVVRGDWYFRKSLSSGCSSFCMSGSAPKRHETRSKISRSLFAIVAAPSEHEFPDYEFPVQIK